MLSSYLAFGCLMFGNAVVWKFMHIFWICISWRFHLAFFFMRYPKTCIKIGGWKHSYWLFLTCEPQQENLRHISSVALIKYSLVALDKGHAKVSGLVTQPESYGVPQGRVLGPLLNWFSTTKAVSHHPHNSSISSPLSPLSNQGLSSTPWPPSP